MKSLAKICLVSLFFFSTASAHADFVLTGMTVFGADSTGGAAGVNRWNTTSGDVHYNLYLTNPGEPTTGSFVNSGDSASLAPSITLSNGSNSIFVFGAPGSEAAFFGANFYFDGAATPGISVFAETNFASAPPFPSFVANSSASTYNLDGLNVAGSGTLSFTNGAETVDLSEFAWSFPTAFGLDRVSPFGIGADGTNDFVGVVTFNVSAVPEPSSALLLLAATPLLNFRRNRRKA